MLSKQKTSMNLPTRARSGILTLLREMCRTVS